MFSLIPRKLRSFFSKLVGKFYRKCKRRCENIRNCDFCKISGRKRRLERKKRKDPELNLRREAIKKSYVNQANNRRDRQDRHLQVLRMENRRQKPPILRIEKIHWKHKVGENMRHLWVKILNVSIEFNCFKR